MNMAIRGWPCARAPAGARREEPEMFCACHARLPRRGVHWARGLHAGLVLLALSAAVLRDVEAAGHQASAGLSACKIRAPLRLQGGGPKGEHPRERATWAWGGGAVGA